MFCPAARLEHRSLAAVLSDAASPAELMVRARESPCDPPPARLRRPSGPFGSPCILPSGRFTLIRTFSALTHRTWVAAAGLPPIQGPRGFARFHSELISYHLEAALWRRTRAQTFTVCKAGAPLCPSLHGAHPMPARRSWDSSRASFNLPASLAVAGLPVVAGALRCAARICFTRTW